MKGKLVPLRRTEGTPSEMSDEALVAACAAGDISVLAALFDRHAEVVHRFLVRMLLPDTSEVEDLVQTTFLEAFGGARRFKGRSTVRTWLLGIAANRVRQTRRGRRHRRDLVLVVPHQADAECDRPDARSERREMLRRLEWAIERLPHKQRAVFVLCDLEGLSGVEAARALACPEGTIYRRLHDARQRLQDMLEAGDP